MEDWNQLFKSMNISYKNIIDQLENKIKELDDDDESTKNIKIVLNNYRTSKKFLSLYEENQYCSKKDEIKNFIVNNNKTLKFYKKTIILDPDHEIYRDDPVEFKRSLINVSKFLDETMMLIKKNKSSDNHTIKVLKQIKKTNKAMLKFIHVFSMTNSDNKKKD